MGTLTDAEKAKLLKLGQLATFKQQTDLLYQTKNITAISGVSATTVQGALEELFGDLGAADITWEVLATPNTGKSKTIRITKGAGKTGESHLDIDFEKEEVRAVIGFVTITEGTDENAGKFFDGQDEVTAAMGVTGAGVYLKSQELKDGVATDVVKYVDASAVIEYLTVGAQTGAAIVLSINPATHEISASIADASIAKGKLDSGVQASLDKADSALQSVKTINNEAVAGSGNIVLPAYLEANPESLTSAQCEALKEGDVVIKSDASGKHAYRVSFKSATGMCLTYSDAENVETIAWDKENDTWSKTDKTVTNIAAVAASVAAFDYATDEDIVALFS